MDFGRGRTDGGLEVGPITDEERPRWRALMRRHHSLGNGGDVGETVRFVALEGGKPVALLCWSAAALYNGPREMPNDETASSTFAALSSTNRSNPRCGADCDAPATQAPWGVNWHENSPAVRVPGRGACDAPLEWCPVSLKMPSTNTLMG